MRNRFFSIFPLNTDLATLLLRFSFGALFIRYGYMKVESYDLFLPMFGDPIGIGSKLSYNLLIFAEFICGFFVAVGFLTRLTVIPIFIAMCVAFFIAHGKDPFDVKGIVFVYMLIPVVLFILGSGRYSIDNLLFKRKDHGRSI